MMRKSRKSTLQPMVQIFLQKTKAPGLHYESRALEQPSPRTAHGCEVNRCAFICKENLGNPKVTLNHEVTACGSTRQRAGFACMLHSIISTGSPPNRSKTSSFAASVRNPGCTSNNTEGPAPLKVTLRMSPVPDKGRSFFNNGQTSSR